MFFDPNLDVAVLRSTHGEVDTRFFLHAVSLNLYVDNVVVYSEDADMGLHLPGESRQVAMKGVDMGRNLKEANVHTCAFGPGLRNIFPVTHQLHCFHFTPSLTVTAPRSSFADIP